MSTPRDTLDRIFRLCLRQNFLPAHRAAVLEAAPVDWMRLYHLSVRHRVAPLVYQNLRACGLDQLGIGQHVRDLFQVACSASLAAFHNRSRQTVEALRLLHSFGLRVMLLKAVALEERVYNPPWLTTPGDSDLLVDRRWDDLPPAVQRELESFAAHHTEVELDYFEHEDMNDCGILPVDFHELWALATPTIYGGQPALLPCDTHQLLALCVNACRKRFLLGKGLLDLSESLASRHQVDWTEFSLCARRWRANYICFAALRLAEELLCAPVPAQVEDLLNVPRMRRRVLHYLMTTKAFTRHEPLHSGRRLVNRRLNTTLFLPYAVQQGTMIRRLRVVWQSLCHSLKKT